MLDVIDVTHRATALLARQEAEEAELLAVEGLKHHADSPRLRMVLAHALLMQGRYREGFREAEVRVHRAEIPARQLRYPEWDGPIAGRSILIWGEQGIGDELMMARFIPILRELGASRITVACNPPCVRVMQDAGADLAVGRFGPVELPKHDCWVAAFSLPYKLGLSLEDISGSPYLSAKPTTRGGIGLVERGNPKNPRDEARSIPSGLLQAAVPQGRLVEPAGDIYDSMCQIAGLDLLITVDTSWAHMAGALGVPCWVLLPRSNLDWRWMRERSDTPWYGSLRLFRQREAGDWRGVIREVAEELRRAA